MSYVRAFLCLVLQIINAERSLVFRANSSFVNVVRFALLSNNTHTISLLIFRMVFRSMV